jgi:hypothetical protein
VHLRWPFVGREAELDHVAQALASRQGVVLVGDAGVGKSRLLGEAVEQAAASGLRVLHVRATRSSGVRATGGVRPAAAGRERGRVAGPGAGGDPRPGACCPGHRRRPRPRRRVRGPGPPAGDPGRRAGPGHRAPRRGGPRRGRRALEGRAVRAARHRAPDPGRPRPAGGRGPGRPGRRPVPAPDVDPLAGQHPLRPRAARRRGGDRGAHGGRGHLDAHRTVHRSPAPARADRRPAPGRGGRRADRPRPAGPGRAAAARPAERDRRRREPRAPRGPGPAGGRRVGTGRRPAEPSPAGRRPARRAGLDPAAPAAAEARGGGVRLPAPGGGGRPIRPLADRRRARRVARGAADHGTPLRARRRPTGGVARPAGAGRARAGTRRPPR